MKYPALLASMLLMATWGAAQTGPRLNTPVYRLGEARTALQQTDTPLAVSAVRKAIAAGLYDAHAVADSKTLQCLWAGSTKREFEEAIRKTRLRLRNPASLQVVTSDIDHFWACFDKLDDTAAAAIFLERYINQGSVGLQTFFQVRMNSSVQPLVQKLRDQRAYYQSIEAVSRNFAAYRPAIVSAAVQLKKLLPDAIFPPIYFLMGRLNNVGTPDGGAGLLIGVEHLCLYPGADTAALSQADRLVLFDTSLVVPLVVHEYLHLQQKNGREETLLELALMEGGADFVTYKLTGKHTDPGGFAFGLAHEAELWGRFAAEMSTDHTDDWLFNTYNPATGYPGNIGYFVGFRICEHYYEAAADKRQALRDILRIQDAQAFLRKSGYGGR